LEISAEADEITIAEEMLESGKLQADGKRKSERLRAGSVRTFLWYTAISRAGKRSSRLALEISFSDRQVYLPAEGFAFKF